MISSNKKRVKKIAYVSGTRADFGLMTSVFEAIKNTPRLKLQLYATGMHLMPEFGYTLTQVKKKFPTVKIIKSTFKRDSHEGSANFAGDFLNKIVKAFSRDKPDFVITLGDRPEMICTAVACLYLGIPTGAIHGGEKTSTVDELARHAITKLSHVHFPATKESAQRLEKMGEDRWRIHTVGAPALDVVLNEKLPSRKELFRELNLGLKEKVVLVTQHPVSGEIKEASKHMRAIINAVKRINLPAVFIYPNADAGGREIISVIKKEKNNSLFRFFPHLEYKTFLALEREAAVWVGNSSAALIESSSFKTPVVNVGTRQLGRQRGANVLDTGYDQDEIYKAIYKSLNDKKYRTKLSKIKNPWGDGKTGRRVAKIIESLGLTPKLLNKQISY